MLVARRHGEFGADCLCLFGQKRDIAVSRQRSDLKGLASAEMADHVERVLADGTGRAEDSQPTRHLIARFHWGIPHFSHVLDGSTGDRQMRQVCKAAEILFHPPLAVKSQRGNG
jgi:hypothetical protein